MNHLEGDFWEHLIEGFLKIPGNTCTVCGHKLDNHVDERDGWRCHSIGQDFYQCECYLRKGRYDEGIEGYDLKTRLLGNPDLKEFKEKLDEKEMVK